MSDTPTMTMEQAIDAYVRLRDKKSEMKKAFEDSVKPLQSTMDRLEGYLLEQLNKIGGDSLKTTSGTVYKSTTTSVTCNEWSKTLDFIRANELWELLEARISKTAALEIIETTKKPIPGAVVSQIASVNVRRPAK